MNNHLRSPNDASELESLLNDIVSVANNASVTREKIISLICAIAYERHFGMADERSYFLLMDLFCSSSGRIQEISHKIRQVSRLVAKSIVLDSDNFSLTSIQFTNVIHEVCLNGYSKLPFTLSKEALEVIRCQTLSMHYDSCLTIESKLAQCTGIDHLKAKNEGIVIARASESSILSSTDIASVTYDPVILSLMKILLGGEPLIRQISLWHSYPDSSPREMAAQFFHFDREEFRFFKLFVFLTDVTDSSGPHIYIPRTHIRDAKPIELLKYQYAKIPDEAINRYHPKSLWQFITCPAGTMFIADTQCWHKGSVVVDGMRTVLQPIYTLSGFKKVF